MILIFDFYGTLVDTYSVIRKTLIEVFDRFLTELKYDEALLRSFFGPTLKESYEKLTNDSNLVDKLIEEYRIINKNYYTKEINLYPKVKESLAIIKKKHKVAILSNRIKSMVDLALEVLKIDSYFDLVLGIDNLNEPKPDSEGIYKIKNYFNIEAEKIVFVGDTLTDVMTAKNAGVCSIACTWALTNKEQFEKLNPDYIVDNYDELLKILEEINV